MFMSNCSIGSLLLAGALALAPLSTCHAFAVSPRQLLEVVDIDRPAISPDGSHVAFRVEQASVELNNYETVWYVQGLNDAAPIRVAGGGVPLRDSAGESLPAIAAWSNDNRWIYYRAFIDGRIAVWRAAADGSQAEEIMHDPADVRDFALDEHGHTLRYSVGPTRKAVRSAEKAEYDHGIHIDSTVPIGQGLFRSGYVGGRMATQRFSSMWFDRMPLLGDVPDRWKVLDLRTGVTRPLRKADGDSIDEDAVLKKKYPDAWVVSRSPTSDRIAMLTRVGERNGERYKPDVQLSVTADKETDRIVCKSPLCVGVPISGIQWRPGRDEVVYTVTDPAQGLAQSIYRWNIATGGVIPVVRSSGLLSGGRKSSSACGISLAAMVCVSATANQPPRLERIDLTTGSRTVLFDPNTALAKAMAGSPPVQFLRWKGADGQVYTGQFYAAKSKGSARPPLFVDYYRCTGFVRGGLGDEWPFASLAVDGISALCINTGSYRLKPAERYDEGLAAVRGAVKLLSARGQIDASKVGMGGLSFGTEVTMWVAMKSNLLKAASVTSPLITANYYLFGSLKGAKFESGLKELWGLGSPEQTPVRWRQISPALNLEKISAPILFQMPEQEYLYGLDYEIPLIRQHRADLYVFPNEPHMKFQPKHKLAAYERNVDWFRFWLQGYEDPAPSKAAQYARWRDIREHGRQARAATP